VSDSTYSIFMMEAAITQIGYTISLRWTFPTCDSVVPRTIRPNRHGIVIFKLRTTAVRNVTQDATS
jgi:hypothetical protein